MVEYQSRVLYTQLAITAVFHMTIWTVSSFTTVCLTCGCIGS